MSILFNTALGILLGAIFGYGLFWFARRLSNKKFSRSLGMKLFLVRIPRVGKEESRGERVFEAEIGKFEQLIANLSSSDEVVFESAVPHVGEEIYFYLAVSKKHADSATKQIQGLWSGASVEPQDDDYNIFNPHGVNTGAFFSQKEHFAIPIRTYKELDSDSAESLLGGFSKVNEVGEGAAFQIVIKKASSKIKKRIRSATKAIKKGMSAKEALGTSILRGLGKSFESILPKSEEEKEPKIVDDEVVKALEKKASKPLFLVNARLITSGPSMNDAQGILEGLAHGTEQFSSPERNAIRIVAPRNPKGLIKNFIFRNFDSRHAMVLNSEEIASIYHFPTSSTEAPGVKWLKSKEASPPAELPSEGTLIGESVFRGQKRNIYVAEDDRRRHVYVIGQTGTGKSTLLSRMIVDDIQKGNGVAVIDPHGDLVEDALEHIPPERLEDIIYFNPGDIEHPIGLNMLDHNLGRPEERTFIVNEMQSIFNKLFAQETMGPMFEQYMRNALLLLMEDMEKDPATLIEVPRIFTDSEFRGRKLSRAKNPVVIDFWEKEAVKAGGEASLSNMTPYITSKFNNFIGNDYMRPIIGQAKSRINFRELMDNGKILLVNLSKGRIGDINAGLLGMIITGKILIAALSRVDIADKSARRNFNLYIDEFQNFTTDSISTILSEARKYGLSLVAAHQFIAQLTETIRDAVFGNVGSQILFRVGAQDAEFLVKQLEPVFDENDLVNIDNYYAYVKFLMRGQAQRPFNIHTFPLEKGDKVMAQELKRRSGEKYGADRAEIERKIYERLRE